jgi:DNA-binding MarR family transcriptional regulator
MDFKLRALPKHEKIRERAKTIPGMDIDSLETYLIFRRVASELVATIQGYMANAGFSEGRLAILLLLREAPEHSLAPSELAEQIEVTRGTITGLLDGLEKAGWVVRKNHPEDRRMLTIQLTEEGLAMLERAMPEHFRRIQEFMSRANLSKEEQKQLVTLLDKVSNGISAFRDPL